MENRTITIPQDVRAAIGASDIPQKLLVISRQYGLTIEQAGIIEQVVMEVMGGAVHPNDFVGKLGDLLPDVEDTDLMQIARDVNVEIFIPVRESLMGMHSDAGTPSAPVAEREANPSRDDILAEIENPTPTIHPISAADQTVAGPAQPHEIVSDAKASEVAHDFIGGKLAEPVSLPTKKAAIDPYREPIA